MITGFLKNIRNHDSTPSGARGIIGGVRPNQNANAKPQLPPTIRSNKKPKEGEFGYMAEEEEARSLIPVKDKNLLNKSGLKTARIPSSEEIDVVETFTGEVLTAKAIQIETNSKRHCAYLDNGWFLIDKTTPLGNHVSDVRQRLLRANRVIEQELLVSMATIRSLYEMHDKLHGENKSIRDIETINGQEAQKFQIEYLSLVEEAYNNNVSDIHIFVRQHETQIAFRVNSELDRKWERRADWGHMLCRAAFAMAGEADPQYVLGMYQGARISNMDTKLPRGVQAIRLQFSPLPGNGRYLVCRILKEGTKNTQSIRDLGYQAIHVDTINKMRRQSEGLTVIAGPTGSGKSTTLVVMISSDMRDNPGKNVITVEDPPEYVIQGAAQFAVMNVKNESEKVQAFTLALGSALRSDPDTVMIGEIRDKSSAGLAFKASLTGHRVYASLHANNAIAIMNRLRDIGVEMYNLTEPSLVAGLIGQRLMRNICPHCSIPINKATEEQLLKNGLFEKDIIKRIGEIDEVASTRSGYKGVHLTNHEGCSHCRRGIAGRATVAETIAPDEDFMYPIRCDNVSEAINVWLNDHQGLTMQEHAIQKMTRGIASPQDVIDVSGDLMKFNMKRAEVIFDEYMYKFANEVS